MARYLAEELPFMATENILMRAVSLGGDRQELHEAIRAYSVETARRMKSEGAPNDLEDKLLGDPRFCLTKADLEEVLDIRKFIGLAPEQTEAFLRNAVAPVLEKNRDVIGRYERGIVKC
jgi:adenylosuccinate lyase